MWSKNVMNCLQFIHSPPDFMTDFTWFLQLVTQDIIWVPNNSVFLRQWTACTWLGLVLLSGIYHFGGSNARGRHHTFITRFPTSPRQPVSCILPVRAIIYGRKVYGGGPSPGKGRQPQDGCLHHARVRTWQWDADFIRTYLTTTGRNCQ